MLAEKLLGTVGNATSPTYIEDVFSTYLYTGTGATQSITNNIDLSTKGGMTWIKSRSAATNNCLFDTACGATKYMNSNATTASTTDANGLTAFGTTGFTLGSGNTTGDQVNTNAATFASWTFRKQPKFFDVVTYTGNLSSAGTATVGHGLGVAPSMVITKARNTTSDFIVWHSSLASASYILYLQSTSAATDSYAAKSGSMIKIASCGIISLISTTRSIRATMAA